MHHSVIVEWTRKTETSYKKNCGCCTQLCLCVL